MLIGGFAIAEIKPKTPFGQVFGLKYGRYFWVGVLICVFYPLEKLLQSKGLPIARKTDKKV